VSVLAFPDLPADPGEVPQESPVRVGSDSHKKLFCRTLLSTFNPYRPAVIDWPKLDKTAQDGLTSLPIWDMAVQTENRAGLNVATYAETIADALLKKAVELSAFEERRHRHVLSNLVQAYGIKLQPEPKLVPPRDAEFAFMRTGYSECIDTFFAFGLFEAAKRTGFFPEALVDTFEPVIHEEGRHILFFVNWVAWHRHNMPLWRRPWFELKVLAVWVLLIWERIGIATTMKAGSQDSNFTVKGADQLGVDLDVAQLMDLCLAENDRRLSGYDKRLLRPNFVPGMARLVRRFMRSHKPN
jgi:hypothetical protein